MADWGRYNDYYQSFCAKRFNYYAELKRREPKYTDVCNKRMKEIAEYVYKTWLIELVEPVTKKSEPKELTLFDF